MADEQTLAQYGIGDPAVEPSEIEQFVEETMRSLSNPSSDAAQFAQREKIDISAVSADAGSILEVRRTEGIDLASIGLLIVTISQNEAVKRVASDLWAKVVLPLIVRRFGADALKRLPPKDSDTGKK